MRTFNANRLIVLAAAVVVCCAVCCLPKTCASNSDEEDGGDEPIDNESLEDEKTHIVELGELCAKNLKKLDELFMRRTCSTLLPFPLKVANSDDDDDDDADAGNDDDDDDDDDSVEDDTAAAAAAVDENDELNDDTTESEATLEARDFLSSYRGELVSETKNSARKSAEARSLVKAVDACHELSFAFVDTKCFYDNASKQLVDDDKRIENCVRRDFQDMRALYEQTVKYVEQISSLIGHNAELAAHRDNLVERVNNFWPFVEQLVALEVDRVQASLAVAQQVSLTQATPTSPTNKSTSRPAPPAPTAGGAANLTHK